MEMLPADSADILAALTAIQPSDPTALLQKFQQLEDRFVYRHALAWACLLAKYRTEAKQALPRLYRALGQLPLAGSVSPEDLKRYVEAVLQIDDDPRIEVWRKIEISLTNYFNLPAAKALETVGRVELLEAVLAAFEPRLPNRHLLPILKAHAFAEVPTLVPDACFWAFWTQIDPDSRAEQVKGWLKCPNSTVVQQVIEAVCSFEPVYLHEVLTAARAAVEMDSLPEQTVNRVCNAIREKAKYADAKQREEAMAFLVSAIKDRQSFRVPAKAALLELAAQQAAEELVPGCC